jgi:hypothetical protein
MKIFIIVMIFLGALGLAILWDYLSATKKLRNKKH